MLNTFLSSEGSGGVAASTSKACGGRFLLILGSGLTESHEHGPGASQVCDRCLARELAHQAKAAVSDSCKQAHITVSDNCKASHRVSLVDS
jgi:hypothetical protein